MIAGVILAGGQAARLGGGDKCLRDLGGCTILSRVVARLTPQVDTVVLNANGDSARFAGVVNCPIIADSIVEDGGFVGPLGGILAGMDWAAAQGFTQILTIAADTPFFPTDLAVRMMRVAAPDAIIMAGSGDEVSLHPTFGLWPVSLRDDLRRALLGDTRKILRWSNQHKNKTVVFKTTPFDPFFNINTPADMVRAEQYCQDFGL